ncbi:rCG60243 [Rattus norvegicus]|uniref:RCG60243 n=1 Tax=Rattus norvegicus TaxID=10116 RepID=A6HSP3_RAT|nr:rCG60243 [Rattus norvegicus]
MTVCVQKESGPGEATSFPSGPAHIALPHIGASPTASSRSPEDYCSCVPSCPVPSPAPRAHLCFLTHSSV